MSDSSLYFVQWCPTCGRALRTRVALLGKRVACHHCRGEFVASATDSRSGLQAPPVNLQRADQLLAYFNSSQRGATPATESSAARERHAQMPCGVSPT